MSLFIGCYNCERLNLKSKVILIKVSSVKCFLVGTPVLFVNKEGIMSTCDFILIHKGVY